MLRTWIIYSASLTATFIFFLCYKMWVSWYLLILLLIIPVIALILCLVSSSTMLIETESSGNTEIGCPAYIKLRTRGTGTFLSYCKAVFRVTDHMGGTDQKLIVSIHDNGFTNIPVDTTHCGAYTFELRSALVYDPFGFFRRKITVRSVEEILIKPVPIIPEVMPDLFGFKAKNLRKSKQPNSEIYDIRDYQAGDPIKSIHWKISAKKDKILIKEPLEEYGGHSRVLLKLTPDRDQLDRHLGQILFTSRFYLDREISHRIRIIPPDRSEIAFMVESPADLERAISKILRIRIPEEEEEASDEN